MLTSGYYWALLLSFTMSHSRFSFPQSWSLRAPAFLPWQNLQVCPSISLHPPAMQCHAFGGFASCAPVLSNLPLTLQSPLKEEDPRSPNNQNNRYDGRSDTEHQERTKGKGRWGDLEAGDGLSSCGRSKELLWRRRKPLQSWVCETYWRWWGAEKRGFTIFPVKTSLMAAFPATPWMEGVSLYLKDSDLPAPPMAFFKHEEVSERAGHVPASLLVLGAGAAVGAVPTQALPSFPAAPQTGSLSSDHQCFTPLLNFAC